MMISAVEWLTSEERLPLLDVRSEGEYCDGHIPGAISGPILTNEERHLVGIEYKNKGREAAIRLGLDLVTIHKQARTEEWLSQLPKEFAVACWRGGLRSEFALNWIREIAKDRNVYRISGGYKAVRRQLLNAVSAPRNYFVLGGLTGTGKTALLRQLPYKLKDQVLDLEAFARHRGSAFGNFLSSSGEKLEQPSQQTFENSLGLQLHSVNGPVLVENESHLLGRVSLPDPLLQQMKLAPLIILEAPLETRIASIYQEYVADPLTRGCAVEQLWSTLESNVKALERRLGGKETKEALLKLSEGRSSPRSLNSQAPWIEILLRCYYDKAYHRSFDRNPREVLFRGNCHQVETFLIGKLFEGTISKRESSPT